MRRSPTPVLGIDLNDREIRAVHVEIRGGKPSVLDCASVALPPDAISYGVVKDHGSVTLALRRLVESMGLPRGTQAVVGIFAEQTSSRIVTVPPCPDSELPALVVGEMDHQGISRHDGVLHDYFAFTPNPAASDAARSVAVLSADAKIVRELAELAESAGLIVSAIEPTHVAELRAAAASLPSSQATFFLVVEPTMTAVSYFVGGRLFANRRIDIGTSHLIGSPVTVPTPGNFFGEEDEPDFPPAKPTAFGPRIDHASVNRLATEALQTMEYVQRDGTGEIECVQIVSVDPEVEPLAEMLERRFGLPTRYSPPPSEISDLRYLVAYGLAARMSKGAFEVPRLDLLTSQRERLRHEVTKRNFFGLLLVSAVALGIGAVGCLLYNRQIAAYAREAERMTAQVNGLKREVDAAQTFRIDADQRYRTLRKEGVPLGAVMDAIAQSTGEGISLKTVSVGEDFKLRIEGEARDEVTLIRAAQRLQTCPVLTGVELGQFDRRASDPSGTLNFQIAGSALTADRVRVTRSSA